MFETNLIIFQVEVDSIGGEAEGQPRELEVGAEHVYLEPVPLLRPLETGGQCDLVLLKPDVVDADLEKAGVLYMCIYQVVQ